MKHFKLQFDTLFQISQTVFSWKYEQIRTIIQMIFRICFSKLEVSKVLKCNVYLLHFPTEIEIRNKFPISLPLSITFAIYFQF